MRGKKSFLLEGQDVLLDCVLTNDLSQALTAPGRVSLKVSECLQLPFEWASTAPFSWLLWVVRVKTTFWHTLPARFSSAEGQPEMCFFCFTKLFSCVKIDTECLAEADPSRIAHCDIVLLREGGKGTIATFHGGRTKSSLPYSSDPFRLWPFCHSWGDRRPSFTVMNMSAYSLLSCHPSLCIWQREEKKRKKRKRRNLIETWICADIRIGAQQVWALRLK